MISGVLPVIQYRELFFFASAASAGEQQQHCTAEDEDVWSESHDNVSWRDSSERVINLEEILLFTDMDSLRIFCVSCFSNCHLY